MAFPGFSRIRGRWSARVHLALFAAAITLPILVSAAFLLVRYAAAEREELEQAAVSSARYLAQAVDRELANLTASAQILALTPALRHRRFEEFHLLTQQIRERIGTVSVLRLPDGQQLIHAMRPLLAPLPNSRLASDDIVLSSKQPYVSDLFLGPYSQTHMSAVTVPVLDEDGAVQYLLDLRLPVTLLRDIIAHGTLSRDWTIAIVDRQGRILARSTRHEDFVGTPATRDLQENTTDREGTWSGFTADGQAVFAAYARSDLSDWRVAVGIRRDDLAAPLQAFVAWLAAIGVGVFAMSGALAWLFANRLVVPIKALADNATALGQGAPVAAVNTAIKEVDRVGQALATASVSLRGREAALRETEQQLRDESRTLETLNRTGAAIASELEFERMVQLVTDAATTLTGAEFGAFFYNVLDARGEAYTLYAISGVPREAFSRFPLPRNTAVFHSTFHGEGTVRSDDITQDPRYGKAPPHFGMPAGHLPVRSYLAVSVISRSGEVLGGLFFGHSKPSVFTARQEQIVAGIAGQAAIAVDNARLYKAAQDEIAERKRVEEHQRLLLSELNHRVKNTLAVVLAIAQQTIRRSDSLDQFYGSFQGRLQALAYAHTLLTAGNWESTSLRSLVEAALAPYGGGEPGRAEIDGPPVDVNPRASLSFSMVFHELSTNASKYGALSVPAGRVSVSWQWRDGGGIHLFWIESGGPRLSSPLHRGFGTKLIELSVEQEIGGKLEMEYRPEGLVCKIALPQDSLVPGDASPAPITG